MDRLYVRGIGNVHKKLLIQAAACNLALFMRSLYGTGKPRAAHDQVVEAILAILAFMDAIEGISQPRAVNTGSQPATLQCSRNCRRICRIAENRVV
jgi:hypothetical protein